MSDGKARLRAKLNEIRGVLSRTHDDFDRNDSTSRARHGTDLGEVIEQMNAWIAEAGHAAEHGDADAHEALSQRGDALIDDYHAHGGEKGIPRNAPAP